MPLEEYLFQLKRERQLLYNAYRKILQLTQQAAPSEYTRYKKGRNDISMKYIVLDDLCNKVSMLLRKYPDTCIIYI